MQGPDDGRQRVGDAEREHAQAVLQRAVARGEIDIDEFSDRVGAAIAARTRSDLTSVLADLPDAELLPATSPELASPDPTAGDSVVAGPWTVPATMQVIRAFGDTYLDLSHAHIPRVGIRVELRVGVGNVFVVVPPACTVDTRRVRATLGRFHGAVGRPVHAPDHHLVVTGTIRLGMLRILPGEHWQARMIRRLSGRRPSPRPAPLRSPGPAEIEDGPPSPS